MPVATRTTSVPSKRSRSARTILAVGLAVCAGLAAYWLRARAVEPDGGVPRIAAIHVTPVNPKLAVGGVQDLTATGTFTDGSKQNVTAQVTWTSAGSDVVKVSLQGEVVALGVGQAAIYGTLAGVRAATVVSISAP